MAAVAGPRAPQPRPGAARKASPDAGIARGSKGPAWKETRQEWRAEGGDCRIWLLKLEVRSRGNLPQPPLGDFYCGGDRRNSGGWGYPHPAGCGKSPSEVRSLQGPGGYFFRERGGEILTCGRPGGEALSSSSVSLTSGVRTHLGKWWKIQIPGFFSRLLEQGSHGPPQARFWSGIVRSASAANPDRAPTSLFPSIITLSVSDHGVWVSDCCSSPTRIL